MNEADKRQIVKSTINAYDLNKRITLADFRTEKQAVKELVDYFDSLYRDMKEEDK